MSNFIFRQHMNQSKFRDSSKSFKGVTFITLQLVERFEFALQIDCGS